MRHFRSAHLISLIILATLAVALLPSPALAQSCPGGYCGSGVGDGEGTKVQVKVSVTVSPDNAGTVLVNGKPPEEGVFTALQGDVLILEAMPNAGYSFVRWSDWFSETTIRVEAPIYNHKTLTAHFVETTGQSERVEPDDAASLKVPAGITALDQKGNALTEVSVALRQPRALPSSGVLIGDVYDYRPDGATFDPPLPISLPYDSDALPEGIAEDELAIAVFDADLQDWTLLPSVVNSEDDVVETEVSHFSEVAVVAPMSDGTVPLVTPGFSFSSLSVSPSNPYEGEEVAVSVIASYMGGNAQARSRVFVLLDGKVADETEIALSPGDHVFVTLAVTPEKQGTCAVEINGLMETINVGGAPAASALNQAVSLANQDTFAPLNAAAPTIFSRLKPVAYVAGGLVVLLLIVPLAGALRRRVLRYRYDL